MRKQLASAGIKDTLSKIPSRKTFYKELKYAICNGIIAIESNNNFGHELSLSHEIIRRSDGRYLKDLYIDIKGIFSSAIPFLLSKIQRDRLSVIAEKTCVANFFSNVSQQRQIIPFMGKKSFYRP
jgi:hypothetical protein